MATLKLITTSEIWKPVPGWEDKFMASNLGQVCSIRDGVPFRILKAQPTTRSKYLYLKLGNKRKGTRKSYSIHSLVMRTFVGPPPQGLQINHKDCNRYNNTLENLEYVTFAYNRRHATLSGAAPSGKNHYTKLRPEATQKGESHPAAKLTEEQVREIRQHSSLGLSIYKIAAKYGVSPTTIHSIIRRKRWKHI